MPAYYNEIDAYAAQWLRNLIGAGHIAPGDVDERDIREVSADDLVGYQQVHLFAGIGGWSLALRLAGWPNDEPVFTGSCPCQPLSSAGQRKGHADERHLWPAFYCLIAERRPATVFGEQVASKDGREWLAGVRADLEHLGYACGAADLPAASVGAPHIRQRLWWVANANGGRREGAQVPVRQSRQNETSAIERGAGSGLANDQRQRPRAGEPVAGAHGGILGHTITPHERDGGGVADAECSKRGKVDRARRVEGGDGLPQRQEGSDWARGGGGVGDADCPRHALGAHGSAAMMERRQTRPEGKPLSKQVLGANATSFPAPTERRGALNPAFSRWFMGFPAEWDACAPTATPSSRKSRPPSSKRRGT